MSNLPLDTIARQSGFADAYHFSRRFRAIYGIAPSVFRSLPPESAPTSQLTAGGLAVLRSLVPPP
jgi:AraC-like DNA-binding protein